MGLLSQIEFYSKCDDKALKTLTGSDVKPDFYFRRPLWLFYGERLVAGSWQGVFSHSPGKEKIVVKIAKCHQEIALEISSFELTRMDIPS